MFSPARTLVVLPSRAVPLQMIGPPLSPKQVLCEVIEVHISSLVNIENLFEHVVWDTMLSDAYLNIVDGVPLPLAALNHKDKEIKSFAETI